MKKFAVILQYLSRYKGKLVLYMFFNILSIVFGLISVGMLSPFLDILFNNDPFQGGKAAQQCDRRAEGSAYACCPVL